MYVQRMDPLLLTPHIENCIQFLSDNAECEADAILVCLARVQIVYQRTVHIPRQSGNEPPGNLIPVGVYLRSLQSQLRQMKDELPSTSSQNCKSNTTPTSEIHLLAG